MRQYIVAKNVLDIIFYYHIGHGEREKNNISREEMSSADNYKKEYYLYFISIIIYIFILCNFKPFRIYQKFLNSHKTCRFSISVDCSLPKRIFDFIKELLSDIVKAFTI